MRRSRIKDVGGAYYHIMHRVIDRQMLLDREEKERFCKLMRHVADFCGVRILTYTVLTNHVHMLVCVPQRQEVNDKELIRRLGFLYDNPIVRTIERRLAELREQEQDSAAEVLKAHYTYRMCELSEFGKTLFQRFTQSFNARHNRTGTLWNGRFKSILAQGSPHVLSAMAAYIDLNAVRAGLVADPKDYRFCGYAEAVAGSRTARKGLSTALASLGRNGLWQETAEQYRKLLHMAGEQQGVTPQGGPAKPGFSPEKVKSVLEAGGALSLQELLRCRVRYFTDGAILGSRAYVDDAVRRHREHFGQQRKTGARTMKGGGWGGLYSARRLRLAPISIPTSG